MPSAHVTLPGLGRAPRCAFVRTQAFAPYHQAELSQMPCNRRPEPSCPPSPSVVLPSSLTLAPQDPCPMLHSRADQCCGKAWQALRVRPTRRARPHPLCLDSLGDALGRLSCPFLSEGSSHHRPRTFCVGIVFSVQLTSVRSSSVGSKTVWCAGPHLGQWCRELTWQRPEESGFSLALAETHFAC